MIISGVGHMPELPDNLRPIVLGLIAAVVVFFFLRDFWRRSR